MGERKRESNGESRRKRKKVIDRKKEKKERFLTFVLDVEVEEFGFRGYTERILRSK